MTRILPLLIAWVLTALTATTIPSALQAQPTAGAAAPQPLLTALPTADQIRMLLESSDARDQTWGAWWVTQTRARNMDTLLEANLKAHLNGPGILDDALVDATLDALIQVGGNAPPLALLQSVYAARPAQGLILLSRVFPRPPVDAFLLTVLDEEAGKGRGLEWFAAANMLIRDRAPGLAASLLKDLQIQAVVVVCDRGSTPCSRTNLGHRSVGDGGGPRLSGLPPWPLYNLVSQNSALDSPGAALLISGPTSIAYRRNILPAGIAPDTANYPRDSETRTPPSPTTAERLLYLEKPNLELIIDDRHTPRGYCRHNDLKASSVMD